MFSFFRKAAKKQSPEEEIQQLKLKGVLDAIETLMRQCYEGYDMDEMLSGIEKFITDDSLRQNLGSYWTEIFAHDYTYLIVYPLVSKSPLAHWLTQHSDNLAQIAIENTPLEILASRDKSADKEDDLNALEKAAKFNAMASALKIIELLPKEALQKCLRTISFAQSNSNEKIINAFERKLTDKLPVVFDLA